MVSEKPILRYASCAPVRSWPEQSILQVQRCARAMRSSSAITARATPLPRAEAAVTTFYTTINGSQRPVRS